MSFSYKIEYTGSSKLIRRIVDRLNNVAILGTTHDTAYYGDQGEAAYQHSLLTSGNPHRVNLDDLGIGNIKSQIAALLEATGSSANWTLHDKGYELIDHEGNSLALIDELGDEGTMTAPGMYDGDYVIDHDGDYLVFLFTPNQLAWH